MDALTLAQVIEQTLFAFLPDAPPCEGREIDVFEHAQDDHVPEVRLSVDGIEFRAIIERVPDTAPAGDIILAEVLAEVGKATTKFPTWPTRIIDAGNVVSEEAGELAKACLQVTYEKHKETLGGVRMEAIQTAAMALRFLASIDTYDLSPGEQHAQPPFVVSALFNGRAA